MISRRQLLAGLLASAVAPMRLPGRPAPSAWGASYLVFEDIPLERFAGVPIGFAMNSAMVGELVEVVLLGKASGPPCTVRAE